MGSQPNEWRVVLRSETFAAGVLALILTIGMTNQEVAIAPSTNDIEGKLEKFKRENEILKEENETLRKNFSFFNDGHGQSSAYSGFIKFQLGENTFDIFIADLRTHTLRFFLEDEKGRKYGNILDLQEDLHSKGQQLLFAMNGGMFESGGRPAGLYIENTKKLVDLNTNTTRSGNFYLQPNGVFSLDDEGNADIMTTNQHLNSKKTFLSATQSGPMLLIDGKINSLFNARSKNKRIRNGVGILNEKTVIFAISNEETTFYNFASIFKKFGCRNALYLDGVISSMYVDITRAPIPTKIGPIISIVK